MDYRDLQNLKGSFDEKSSEELLEIWRENDRFTWREEAFAAIHEILLRRNVAIPEQAARIDSPKPMSPETKEIIRGAAMVASAVLIAVLCVEFRSPYVILPTGLMLAGAVILFRHGVLR